MIVQDRETCILLILTATTAATLAIVSPQMMLTSLEMTTEHIAQSLLVSQQVGHIILLEMQIFTRSVQALALSLIAQKVAMEDTGSSHQ